MSNKIKYIYYLPPKEPNKVWVSSTYGENKDSVWLSEYGIERKITKKELKAVVEKQNEIYCKFYPKLCRKN